MSIYLKKIISVSADKTDVFLAVVLVGIFYAIHVTFFILKNFGKSKKNVKT